MTVKIAVMQEDNVEIIEHDTREQAEAWADGYLSGADEYGGSVDVVILEPGWEVEVRELDELHRTKRFERITEAMKEFGE